MKTTAIRSSTQGSFDLRSRKQIARKSQIVWWGGQGRGCVHQDKGTAPLTSRVLKWTNQDSCKVREKLINQWLRGKKKITEMAETKPSTQDNIRYSVFEVRNHIYSKGRKTRESFKVWPSL